MEVSTPFDAALQELLRAWRARDDLRQHGDPDEAAVRAAFVALDRARVWMRKATAQARWRFERRDDPRTWLSAAATDRVRETTQLAHGLGSRGLLRHIDALTARNRHIHERASVNLNPATNAMNPRAEQAMASGLGSRPSLGHPGEKYEMGLEAIEQIEVIAADLAAEVFAAPYAEVRVASGAMANLMAFMATCRPGQAIIAQPPEIGGHVTHHDAGAAGLYGLEVHHAPVDRDTYTVDVDALARMAERVRPALITLGGSLNYSPHPVAEVRRIADAVGARLLFDAAHLCGLIAGGAWPNPLVEGADLMTMSTYKSLAGPPGGLVMTADPALAERLDRIAHPGLTANFDVGRVAALAITLVDWVEHGRAYAHEMVRASAALAGILADLDVPVFRPAGATHTSHQFALDARTLAGGTVVGGSAAAQHLRRANLLTSAIGLPLPLVEGDAPGLRLGTPEVVRWGMTGEALPQLGSFIAQAWHSEDPGRLAERVARFRTDFRTIHHIVDPA